MAEAIIAQRGDYRVPRRESIREAFGLATALVFKSGYSRPVGRARSEIAALEGLAVLNSQDSPLIR